jgi:predicted DNA-binding transcriptional regulator AlpA
MIKDDDFPEPIKLTKKRLGFVAEEVSAWLADKIKQSREAG